MLRSDEIPVFSVLCVEQRFAPVAVRRDSGIGQSCQRARLCYSVYIMVHASTTMTVRLDRETRRRLERLARATARSRAFLAQQAIRDYLDLQEWQVSAIEAGVRAADEGHLVGHKAVESWIESWGARREKRRPR